MTIGEAAKILGITVQEATDLQAKGDLPNPIPDDYLDAVVGFRIKLEEAHRRRMDAFSRGGRDATG